MGYIKRLKSYRIKATRQKEISFSSSIAPAETQCDHGPAIWLRSLGAQSLHGIPGWRQNQAVFPMGHSICGEQPLCDLLLLDLSLRLTSCVPL